MIIDFILRNASTRRFNPISVLCGKFKRRKFRDNFVIVIIDRLSLVKRGTQVMEKQRPASTRTAPTNTSHSMRHKHCRHLSGPSMTQMKHLKSWIRRRPSTMTMKDCSRFLEATTMMSMRTSTIEIEVVEKAQSLHRTSASNLLPENSSTQLSRASLSHSATPHRCQPKNSAELCNSSQCAAGDSPRAG